MSRTHVVDYHGDCLHIYSTGEDVGGYEDFGETGSECVNDHITLMTFEGSGQRGNFVTFCCHPTLDLCGSFSLLLVSNLL